MASKIYTQGDLSEMTKIALYNVATQEYKLGKRTAITMEKVELVNYILQSQDDGQSGVFTGTPIEKNTDVPDTNIPQEKPTVAEKQPKEVIKVVPITKTEDPLLASFVALIGSLRAELKQTGDKSESTAVFNILSEIAGKLDSLGSRLDAIEKSHKWLSNITLSIYSLITDTPAKPEMFDDFPFVTAEEGEATQPDPEKKRGRRKKES